MEITRRRVIMPGEEGPPKLRLCAEVLGTHILHFRGDPICPKIWRIVLILEKKEPVGYYWSKDQVTSHYDAEGNGHAVIDFGGFCENVKDFANATEINTGHIYDLVMWDWDLKGLEV